MTLTGRDRTASARRETRSRPPDDAIARIRRELADDGIDIDAETSRPRSEGTRCDLELAIEALVCRHPAVATIATPGAAGSWLIDAPRLRPLG